MDSKSSLQTAPPPGYDSMRFQRDFGFYKVGRRDQAIALSKSSPALFYISIQSPYSSRPTIILSSGPNPASAPLATANLRSFSSEIEVTVGGANLRLVRVGAFSRSYSFVFPIGGRLETFEWRSSTGPEIQALDGGGMHGMKLVHVVSNKVVAAWARPHSSVTKQGKMRFTASDRGSFGNDFETAAVITMSAIMEKRRRARASGAAGGAAGGAAAC